ncbi:RluA family pseudouridine synthase [Alicyclobacillus dauci]|uniref:Pseudouridine synthase n=1 Tax=Alicyclobacillus dauci TaxID=1475485 RepID=A0ABY6Z0H6_9BACL|nr:RluA family pseudouridine synthase [Alicyclobacillus dauci]WAH35849.1 RluA family pseudouridine synthase [Alicyclobacillus dauci]
MARCRASRHFCSFKERVHTVQCEMVAGALHVRPGKRFDNWRIDDFLKQGLQLPDGFVRRLFAAGGVRMGRLEVAPDTLLRGTAKVVLTEPKGERSRGRQHGLAAVSPPPVLYEDDHILVVSKRAGIIVHSDQAAEETLDSQVALHYARSGQDAPVLHVHRLDKPTTGAVLYAKHGFMARALDEQLVTHGVERRYLAVVFGAKLRKEQLVDKPIGRDRHRAGLYRVSSTGKEARTHFYVQASKSDRNGTLSLLKCKLETGRTHQIRVHTAALGAPILGDTAYGGTSNYRNWPASGAIALHAAQLRFYHPYEEKDIVVDAPMSDDWISFLGQEWSLDAQRVSLN